MVSEMLAKIKDAKKVIVIGHVTPDGDCLGDQFGLKEIIKDSYNKEVYAVGEASETLAFMGKLDNVADEVFKESLVVLVDVATIDRISDDRYKLAKDIIKFDHHLGSEKTGSIDYVIPNISSVCEMLALIAYENKLKVSKYAAESLLTGIITDSGSFKFDGVSPDTFKAASFLLECGADIVEVNKKISMVTIKELKMKAYVIDNMKTTDEGFAYCVITKKAMDEHECIYEEASNALSSLANIYGYPIWALILEKGDEYRIRLRSNGPRIDTLAHMYDGGGHKMASGCHIFDLKEVENFAKDADEILRKYKRGEE